MAASPALSAQQQRFVEVCHQVATNPRTSWVMFSHGTIVFLPKATAPSVDLSSEALAIMREFGPVGVGSAAGDFGVVDLDDEGERCKGWVVTGHHPDMLTMVLPDEVSSEAHLGVGLYGRGKRDNDASDLTIIHVEDKRAH